MYVVVLRIVIVTLNTEKSFCIAQDFMWPNTLDFHMNCKQRKKISKYLYARKSKFEIETEDLIINNKIL